MINKIVALLEKYEQNFHGDVSMTKTKMGKELFVQRTLPPELVAILKIQIFIKI